MAVAVTGTIVTYQPRVPSHSHFVNARHIAYITCVRLLYADWERHRARERPLEIRNIFHWWATTPIPSSTDCTCCVVSRYSLLCGSRKPKWSSLSMGTARLQFSNEIIRNWWSDVLWKILNHLSFLFCLNTFSTIIYSAMYHFSLTEKPPLLQIRGIRARAFGKLVWRFFFLLLQCVGWSFGLLSFSTF